MSVRTQGLRLVALWAGAAMLGSAMVAELARAGDVKKPSQRQQHFEESQRQLQTAHQEYFEGLDRYFEAVSSARPDPARIEQAQKNLQAIDSRIEEIKQVSLERFREAITSSVFIRSQDEVTVVNRSELGEDDDDERDDDKNNSAPAEKGSLGKADAVVEQRSADPLSPGSRLKSRISDPSPSRTTEDPSITNAEGPRQFVFGKKGKSPLPTPSTTPGAPAVAPAPAR